MNRGNKPVVVIVNDQPSQLRLASAILARDDYEVRAYQSAGEALKEMGGEAPPALIVTDLHMPGIDGWRFCRLLRSEEFELLNKTPILVTSATYSGIDAQQVTLGLGANSFLPAPFAATTLRSHARALLEGRTPPQLTRVLLVEDSPTQAKIMKEAFEARGYSVHLAGTIEEGRRLAQRQVTEIAVLDYHLPDGESDSLLADLKAGNKVQVAVVVTSDPTPELARRFMQLGADAYVRKPCDPSYLVDLCEKAQRERALLRVEDVLEARTLELRESERRLRTLFAAIPEVVIVYDNNGAILHANESAVAQLDWSADELTRMNMADILAPDAIPKVHTRGDGRREETGWYFDTAYLSRSGRRFDVEVRERRIDFEGRPTTLCVARDLSTRREADEQLRRLTMAVEQADEAITICDPQGTIEYVNPAFVRITGYPPGEAIGKTPRILKSGQHDEAFYCDLWDTLKRGETWKGHFTNRREDGRLFEAEVTISPVRDASGQVINYVAVTHDVTHVVSLEARLRQAIKMEAIGRVAGGVAHDFNNLLTGILGPASMLRAQAEVGTPTHESAAAIEVSASRAAELTKQLLAFARKGKSQSISIDVHHIIKEVASLLGHTVDRSIAIDARLQAAQPWVCGDPSQMQQVILNLGVNARDAMPEGGQLTFSTDFAVLDDEYCRCHPGSRPGRYLMVEVRDTGCGIPPDIQERIFEPFFTTKSRDKGTGMGLAMVYGIIKNHGGWIYVDSEEGEGTTFQMYLPPVDVPPEPRDEEAAPEVTSGTGRILLVDDEQVVREVAAAMLKSFGYEVRTATDGAEAVEVYRKVWREIDCVILDVVMPNMNGRECLCALKEINPDVRAIVSSGYDQGGQAQSIIDEGALGFIQKPYDMAALSTAVAKGMGQDRADG